MGGNRKFLERSKSSLKILKLQPQRLVALHSFCVAFFFSFLWSKSMKRITFLRTEKFNGGNFRFPSFSMSRKIRVANRMLVRDIRKSAVKIEILKCIISHPRAMSSISARGDDIFFKHFKGFDGFFLLFFSSWMIYVKSLVTRLKKLSKSECV